MIYEKIRMSGFMWKIKIGECKERGRGIYAAEFIPKGSLVWTLVDSNHLAFSHEELCKYLETRPDEIKYILNHIYIYKSKAILCTDSAELVNHSSNPNLCESDTDGRMGCWAARDIYPDEELLDSYRTYETPDWYLSLCKLYGVESSKDVVELYK